MTECHQIYLFFFLISLLSNVSIQTWKSNINLFSANCSEVRIGVRCPTLTKKRELQIFLYQVQPEKIKFNKTYHCPSSNALNISISLEIKCIDLYQIKISFVPTFNESECTEYCTDVQTSPTWLLGDLCPKQQFDHCSHDKYKTSKNTCPASSQTCSTTQKIKPRKLFMYSKVRLTDADCKTASFKAECPNFQFDSQLTFILYNRQNLQSQQEIRKPCKGNTSAIISVLFTLSCKGLYRLNVSFQSIDKSVYGESYTVNDSNQLWLLGGQKCSRDFDTDCQYDKYKSDINKCGQSSTPCGEIQTFAEWRPNIALTAAYCSNLMVQATCPFSNVSRNMEFSLFKKGDENIAATVTKICNPFKNSHLSVNFDFECRALYYVNISMSPITPYMICDEFCSVQHSSTVWLLGRVLCGNMKLDYCKVRQYETSKNHCFAKADTCKSLQTYKYFWIGLSIALFIALLFIVIVAYKFSRVKQWYFTAIGYRRANEIVLLSRDVGL